MRFVLNKKDLRYDWFSGTGAGGQHRNKHMNCLRLTHTVSGITVTAKNYRSRVSNELDAMARLTILVKSFYHPVAQKERFRAKEKIRSYREPDDIVRDHASKKEFSYKKIIINADADHIDEMITARRSVVE